MKPIVEITLRREVLLPVTNAVFETLTVDIATEIRPA